MPRNTEDSLFTRSTPRTPRRKSNGRIIAAACAAEVLENRQMMSVSAAINFQPSTAAVPAGYLKDSGASYASRGNGYTYGWSGTNSSTRDRGTLSDQRYDTMIHTQLYGAYSWEMAVPNGTYRVRVVGGDPATVDSVISMNVEGQNIVKGTPTSTNRFVEGTGTVTVSDGKLTLTNGAGASNNKLAFIEITQIDRPAVAGNTYVSDLPWTSATNGAGPVEKDTSVGGTAAGDGKVLNLGGVTYAKGLGVQANSSVVYNLGGKYDTFLASVGVDASAGANASVIFRVLADGRTIYDSGVMTKSTAAKTVGLAVAGVAQLTLVVDNAGSASADDKADWADARLVPTTVVAPTPVPAAPSGLTASAISSSQVKLNWTDNSTTETGFTVLRSTDGTNFTTLATLGANAVTYTDSTAAASTTYHYRVTASNSSGTSAASNTSSATTPAPVSSATQGLTATYFDNGDFTSPVATRVDSTVNFDWGLGAPAGVNGTDNFSVRWTGQVLAPKTGTYTFKAETDEGARLWIDNLLVVDNWDNPRDTYDNGLIYLEAGKKYDIKYEYADKTGDASAQLRWSAAGLSEQVIPTSQLTPTITPARQQAMLYVSTTGSDSNAGSATAPFRTIAKAVSMASSNNTRNIATRVIIQPGTYREGFYLGQVTGQTEAPISIEAAQKGTVIIDGADIWTGWRQDVNGTYSHAWTTNWGPSSTPAGWPSTPELLRRREMLFVNGKLLKQVLSLSSMTDNTFFVDEAGDKVYMKVPAGTDVANAKVEWGQRQTLVQINGRKNVTLSGLTVQHAVSSLQGDAVQLYGSKNVLMQDMSVQWNSHEGVTNGDTTNVIQRRNNVSNNGGTGVGGSYVRALTMEDNITSSNNWRGGWAGFIDWDYAGVKNLFLRDAIYRGAIADSNVGRGLWFDTDVVNVLVEGAKLRKNVLDGIFIEANTGPFTIRDSILAHNIDAGILVANTSNVTLLNNIFYANQGTPSQVYGQITISGNDGGRTYTPWGGSSTVTAQTENWVMEGNHFIGTAGHQLGIATTLGGTAFSRFANTLRSNNNVWYNPATTTVVRRDNGVRMDLAAWRTYSGEDMNSVFQDPKYADPTNGDFTRLP